MFSYPRINIGFIVLSIFLGIVFALLRIFSVFTDFTAFIGVLLAFAITCLLAIIAADVKCFVSERDRFNFYDRERNRDGRFIFGRCGASLLGFALAAVFSSAVFLLVRGNTFTEGMFILFSVFADTYLALGLFSCLQGMTGNACGAFKDNDRLFATPHPETDENENRYEDTSKYHENYRGNNWEDYLDNRQENYRDIRREEDYRENRREEDYRENRRDNYRDNRQEEDYRENRQENYRGSRREEDYRDSRRRNSSSRNSSRNNRR